MSSENQLAHVEIERDDLRERFEEAEERAASFQQAYDSSVEWAKDASLRIQALEAQVLEAESNWAKEVSLRKIEMLEIRRLRTGISDALWLVDTGSDAASILRNTLSPGPNPDSIAKPKDTRLPKSQCINGIWCSCKYGSHYSEN
jgi:hypothetical protein